MLIFPCKLGDIVRIDMRSIGGMEWSKTREEVTGEVVFVHPDGLFVTVEITTLSGDKFRETISRGQHLTVVKSK